MSGLSRIPKLSFGKRTPQTSGIPSRESTPVQCHDDRGTAKSAPAASKDSSIIVGRSKSLRLPRKQYGTNKGGSGGTGLESSSTSKIETRYRHSNNHHGGSKLKDSSSSPGSSRASSPGNTMATNSIYFTSSTEVSGADSDLVKSGSENPFIRRRAQSFGPHVRRPNNRLRPPSNNRSRENTPTPRSITPSTLPAPSPSRRPRHVVGVKDTPSGHRHVRSRSSLGTNSNGSAADSIAEEDSKSLRKTSRIRRVDSNNTIDGGSEVSRSSVMSGGAGGVRRTGRTVGTRGRRPNSYVMEPADLNQLAQEITSSIEDGSSLHTLEIKSVAKIHSSPRHRDTTPSVPSGKSITSSSNSHTPLGSTRGQKLSGKTSGEMLGRSIRYNFQTPESGGGKNGRTKSVVSGGSNDDKLHSRGILNSRSSTPSSGRSTPVSVTTRTTPSEVTPAGGAVRPQGSGLKSTQRRFVRVREARPVGINELEGAVLMDSDEYLKISHEVKALKTAILKLKRELQNGDGHVTDMVSSTPSGSTPRRQGGGQNTDSIKQITMEKTRALEEAEKYKKQLQNMSEKLSKMTSDLKRTEDEKLNLTQQLQQMENHRDLLLDKVERLHADKHKLEDRLSSLEKAQFYEKSSSCWIREGGEEGEGGWEDTVMLDGMKGEKTESDIGESSEPESSAVCSGPHT